MTDEALDGVAGARPDGFDACWDGVLQHAPVGMFLADPSGECLRANERLGSLLGLRSADVLGRGWINAVHMDDRARVLADWQAATAAATPFRAEFRVIRSDLVRVIVEANEVPGGSGDGVWIGTVTDVSSLAAREQGLADEDAALKIAADHTHEFQVLLEVCPGADLRVVFVNRPFLKIAQPVWWALTKLRRTAPDSFSMPD